MGFELPVSRRTSSPPSLLSATNTVDGEIATEFGMNCGPNADQFNRDACELVRAISRCTERAACWRVTAVTATNLLFAYFRIPLNALQGSGAGMAVAAAIMVSV